MEININNKKSLERLFNQSIGYSLLTVSSEYGVQKIALKKNKSKDTYNLIYCSGEEKDDETIKTVEVIAKLKKDGLLVIKGLNKFTIEDACFKLMNPSRRVLADTKALRKMANYADQAARSEEQRIASEIIKDKDEEIKSLNEDLSYQQRIHTYGRVESLARLGLSLIEIKEHKSLSIKEYEYGYERREYKRTVYDEVDEQYKYGVSFIAELLKDKFRYSLSDDSLNLCDEINLIDKKIDAIYYGIRNSKSNDIDFDSKITNMSALFGVIAKDLKSIIFDLCDSVYANNTDTSFCKYEDSGVKDYWDNGSGMDKNVHEIYRRTIDNLFDSILDGSVIFVERVTGEDIRSEINKRLGKYNKENKYTK